MEAGGAFEDDDRDWRLTGEIAGRQERGVLHSFVERMRDPKVLGELRAAVGDEVVITHDGNRLFAYAASRAAIERARTAIEQVLESDGLSATLTLSRYSESHDEWLDPDAPEPEPAAETSSAVVSQTLVASVGKMVREELEESMMAWAGKLGLRCEIVEHPHLLTTQVAFTVTGPSRKVQEFASGLAAEERATIRTEREVMISPL